MGKSVTRYVNMHGSKRLTTKEAEAIQTIINLGIADAEALVHDGDDNGVITSAELGRAQAAAWKLYSCLYDTKKKAGDEP